MAPLQYSLVDFKVALTLFAASFIQIVNIYHFTVRMVIYYELCFVYVRVRNTHSNTLHRAHTRRIEYSLSAQILLDCLGCSVRIKN